VSTEAITIEFEVEEDESGGYNASARVGTHSLITEADDLESLRVKIIDLLSLYAAQSDTPMPPYAFHFRVIPQGA
jgi:hypothetical protein